MKPKKVKKVQKKKEEKEVLEGACPDELETVGIEGSICKDNIPETDTFNQ